MSNKPFFYQNPFPLAHDDTEYYLLTKEHVSVAEFDGQEVLKVEPEALTLLAQPELGSLPGLACALLAAVLHLTAGFMKPAKTRSQPSNSSYDSSQRDTGTVKWFNTSKGFGFISRDSGDDIFVHFRAIRGEGHRVLVEGQRVEFSVMNRDKGLQAEDVIAAPRR